MTFNIPTIPYFPWIMGGVGLILGSYGGYWVTSNYYKAQANKEAQQVIEQLTKQEKINTKTIVDLNTNVKTLQDAYIILGEKRRAIKVTNVACGLTVDSARLWDASLLGKEVLSSSPNGTNATGGASTTTIPIEQAFDNKLENDKRCAINREKIKKLNDWCISTFGEDRCKGVSNE